MDRGLAPQGLQNSAQGFNPGNPQKQRFALKLRGTKPLLPVEDGQKIVAKLARREKDLFHFGCVVELNLRALQAHHGKAVERADQLDILTVRFRRGDGWNSNGVFGCRGNGRQGGVIF
jgi:hypothetical protein